MLVPRLFDLDFQLITDSILSIIACFIFFCGIVVSIIAVVMLIKYIKKELKR